MSEREYDNKNQGAVFPAANMNVYRQGKVDVEGVERNLIITETHNNRNGETYYDVYEKVGRVSPNRKKKNEDSPDMIGEFETNQHGVYMMFGKKRTAKNSGQEFTSIGVKKKDEQPEVKSTPHTATETGFAQPSQPIEPAKTSNPF
mgnify:CR=1 FL=1